MAHPRPRCIECGRLTVNYRLLIRPLRDRTTQRQRRFWLCERHGWALLDRLPKLDQYGVEVEEEPGAVNFAKRLLGIGSPSKVFRDIGQNIVSGFVDGIASGKRAVLTASLDLSALTTFGATVPAFAGGGSPSLTQSLDVSRLEPAPFGGGVSGHEHPVNVYLDKKLIATATARGLEEMRRGR